MQNEQEWDDDGDNSLSSLARTVRITNRTLQLLTCMLGAESRCVACTCASKSQHLPPMRDCTFQKGHCKFASESFMGFFNGSHHLLFSGCFGGKAFLVNGACTVTKSLSQGLDVIKESVPELCIYCDC